MSEDLQQAELFDSKPFATPRVPQRFVFDDDGRTRYGICWPYPDGSWKLQTMQGFALFESDPWEVLGHVIGSKASSVAWLDNDFGWQGKSLDVLHAELVPANRPRRPRRPRFDQLVELVDDRLNGYLPDDREIVLRFSPSEGPSLELIEILNGNGARFVVTSGAAAEQELRRLIDLAIERAAADDEEYDEEEEEDDD